MATLAALAGFAVAMARGADHEARSLRSQRLAPLAAGRPSGEAGAIWSFRRNARTLSPR